MAIKLISINIEGQKHLKTVAELLVKEKGDVVCLMEACEDDVLSIAGDEYPFVIYAPTDVITDSGKVTGVAMLSKYPIFEVAKTYFGENKDKYIKLPGMGTHAPALLMAKIMNEEVEYQIGTIHFSWTKAGYENERQVKHMDKLLEFLKDKEEFVLCGDFNIPRGYPLYYMLKENYKDNIPQDIITTIDPKLHRANKQQMGKLQLVVDYVWTCLPAGRVLPKYKVSEVRVVSGVSDHCALVCYISLV